MKCVNCGKEIEGNARFCSYCGADQNQVTASVKENNYSVDMVENGTRTQKERNYSSGGLITQTVNDFEKERANYRKLAVFSLIIGVLGLVMGFYFLTMYEKTYFDNDVMEFLTFAIGMIIILAGIVLLICAVLFPILSYKVVGKNVIRVYDDHVEGTARRFVNNYGKFQDFYLRYSDIESVRCKAVTVSSAIVEITLPDGSAIRSAAENANEVVGEIQKRLGR